MRADITVAPARRASIDRRKLSTSGSSGTRELYTRRMSEGPEKDALATPEEAAWANGAIGAVRAEVHKVIVGQDRVLDETLLALLCGGHAVVEGVPGLAKKIGRAHV